jgi:O-antigen ligase
MIIPKMVFLVLTASFLTPSLFLIIKNNFQIMSMLLKTVLIIVVFIVIQMVMVMIFTDSPLEQQFFGKTGRGLGFLTYLSLLIIFSTSIFVFQRQTIAKLCYALFYSSFLTSVYAIIQFYGFDIFNWTTRTNGIIGTIGNPNFQSSFSAIALITCFYYYHENSRNLKIFAIGNAIVSLYAIYLCQSWQGYALVIIGLILLLLQYFWYWSKALFKVSSLIVFLTSIPVFFGIFKIGPLSDLLYKYSVKSRGEMWRSSFNASKDNPIFGIGIDSFGDYSLRYRNPVDVGGVNEFTDNSHNYYLEFSTTGGFPLLILNLILIVMVFYSLMKLIRRTSSFDPLISTFFCVWACHIAQSVISPASIPLLIWNYVMSGALIGLASGINFEYLSKISKVKNSGNNFVRSRWLLVAFSIFLLYPYYEVDRLYLATSRSGDGLMAVRVAQMYPESVLRYQRIGRELLDSKLYDQALEVSRAAARFNPDSFSAWALILSNPKALDSERKIALQELKRIDPLNPEIKALRL